ncbi:hypothetical protein [Aquimarina sp. 2304DJ70-9]|uniref:hypothetical protein n=1 Tax=Aquimarina penaris TaxID=3231044 RepID=UPI003461ED89
MNKEELIKKLASNSFKDYLIACNHLSTYVQDGGELNQEIIERALFVNLLPLWAEHEDLFGKYNEITAELPNHSELLNNEKTKSDLMGLSLFVNGLINGEFDVSGFFWCSNGYMCCSTSCKSISEHYKEEGKNKESKYFLELSEWFMEIYSGTTDVFGAIMKIDLWNESMVVGLTNFLNESLKHYGVFEWILSGLYKVIDDPLIKEKVFDHYISILTKSRENLKKEKKKEEANDLTEKLKNLRKLAKGKSI